MKLSQLKIDPEFQSKIPPLQFEEEQQLEQNIIAEGRLLNPIITWNGYILDGHTRYRILKKHGFIKFEVEEIQLANKYEALAWICKNQLGRRNLSPERKKFLLGKEYESTKLAVGAPLGSKHGIRKCGQNDHIFTESRTCQRIASEHGVGEKTVRRAEKYSRGIDAAEEAVPGAQEGQCGCLPCRCDPGCGPLHLRIRGRVQPGAAGAAAGKDTPENHHAAGSERHRQFCKPSHAADSPPL